LAEIHRVLRPGGIFLFGAHNLDGPIKSAWRFAGFIGRPTPAESIAANGRAIRSYFTGIANHLRQRRWPIRTPEYSIINDSSYNYRLLTYYMRKDRQIAQLETAGFADVRVYNLEGAPVEPAGTCRDKWLHYQASKP